jgi:nucleoside-diphosphate-sugar epimerase
VTDHRATGRIYNVAEPDALSEGAWARQIGEAAGWKGEVVIVPEALLPVHLRRTWDADQHWVVDSTRIRQELGYEEPLPRAEALRRAIAWERANPPEKIDSTLFDYATEDSILNELKRAVLE